MKTSIIIYLTLFTFSLYGQGVFLEKGKSGLGISGEVFSNNDFTLYSGMAGYSIKGIFDIGFSVQSSIDNSSFRGEVVRTIIAPVFAFYPHKQNETIPVSLVLSARYEWHSFYGTNLNDIISATGRYYVLQFAISKYYQLSKSIKIQPTIGFTYKIGGREIISFNANEKKIGENLFVYDFGLPVIFFSGQKKFFVISPGVNITDLKASYGLGLSLIFSTK